MFVFGGILELTKELGDLICFDFSKKTFSSNDNDPSSPTMANAEQKMNAAGEVALADDAETSSPMKRNQTMGNKSPLRGNTIRKQGTLASTTTMTM